jgi:hypothetical protein
VRGRAEFIAGTRAFSYVGPAETDARLRPGSWWLHVLVTEDGQEGRPAGRPANDQQPSSPAAARRAAWEAR